MVTYINFLKVQFILKITFIWSVSCSIMSDSLQPLDCSPGQAPLSMEFPGKSTGVGCRSLLQAWLVPSWCSINVCWQVQWLCDLGRSKFQLSPQWDGNSILCLEIRGKSRSTESLMKGTPSPAWVQRWIFLEAQHRAEPRCVWWWPFAMF